MAKKRDFKKDVDDIFVTVVDECAFTADFFPEKAEAAENMIDEAVELYNDTRYAYKLDDKISYKKFYDGLFTNYLAKMSDILTRLNDSQK